MNELEKQSILAFLFTCDELRKTRFGRQFQVSPCKTYRLQPNTVYSTKFKEINNEQWRSFVLSFRKLVLNSEVDNFNRALNVLSKYGKKTDQRRIRIIKKEIKAAEESISGIVVGVGNPPKIIKPKEVFDALVNGALFHNDPARQDELEFFNQAGIFSYGALLHYVVFTYKQALQIEGAIKLRKIA